MGIYILKYICIHTQICIAIYVTYKICLCAYVHLPTYFRKDILGHLDDDFTTRY